MSYEWPERKWRAFAVACILTVASQCTRFHPQPASSVDVGNAATASQLIAGFYNVEDGKWRWTARNFVVSIAPPKQSDRKGAKLSLEFYIPETQIKALGSMTLSADFDTHALPPETYTKGGRYSYVRDVPADFLRSNLVPVLFSFDKAVPPSAADSRELGAVVSKVSLQTTN